MVAPVGSQATPGLGINWQKVDLGPMQMANMPAQGNPASLSFEEKLYGRKEKKHSLLKWIAGIALATTALVIGAKKWGVKIAGDAQGWKGSARNISQKISDNYDNVIKWFKGKWNGTAKAAKEGGEKATEKAADAVTVIAT